MTPEEAQIIILAYAITYCENMPLQVVEAIDIAKETLEKQIPKKPNYIFDGNEHRALCPTCKHFDLDMGLYEWARKYCGECGQAIDWTHEEEQK